MRFIKFFVVVVLVLLIAGTGALLYVTRNHAATHPALADADLPPLIPVWRMRTNLGSAWAYKVSVDARYVSFWTVRRLKEVLVIRETESERELAALDDIGFEYWDPVRPVLRVYSGGRLWEIDPRNPGRENWTDVTPRGFGNWYIAMQPERAEDRLVVTSNERDPAAADLYLVNQDGSNKTLLEQNEGRTTGWLLDAGRNMRFRSDLGADNEQVILRRDGDEWVESFRLSDSMEKLYWIEITPDGDGFLAFSSRGRDKLALVRVDGRTGAEQVLFEDPDVDVNQMLNLNLTDGGVDAIVLEKDKTEWIPLTPRGQAYADLVHGLGDPVDINLLSTSGTGRYVTIAASVREQSWVYYLFDLDAHRATRLGEFGLRRYAGGFAQTRAVTIRARDGVDLHGYLSLPVGAKGPVPFILRVHGGPAMRDVWGYDHERQFLNNRGYAVLTVNFRGSSGYGKAFQALGFGEYGARMQDDLADAARWAVDQGVADPANMVIMGASYGGYAAARAMTRDPGLFKAAIVEYAVLDVPYQMRNNPFAWRLGKHDFERYFGDVNDPAAAAVMRERSPQSHVDALTGPILLIAGKADRVVGFEQSEAFERAAKAAGKDVRAHYFDKAGHGLGDRWQDWVVYSRLVEDFLAEQIGGRSGGWDPAELAARYID